MKRTAHQVRGAPPEEQSFLDQVKWSLLMILVTLAVASIAIPLLRWFGFQAKPPSGSSATGTPAAAH
jgi:hypothetical protein